MIDSRPQEPFRVGLCSPSQRRTPEICGSLIKNAVYFVCHLLGKFNKFPGPPSDIRTGLLFSRLIRCRVAYGLDFFKAASLTSAMVESARRMDLPTAWEKAKLTAYDSIGTEHCGPPPTEG